MALPRVLAVMGSGETAPTMTSVHQSLLARLGPDASAVLLDTPYGFQENAPELAARALTYFADSVGRRLEVASWRGKEATPLEYEQMLSRVRASAYVFAGPGSPTYAARQWLGTALPEVLRDKLREGGCVTFASAAACGLGVKTLPVYEIYKSGEPLHWDEGIDLLSALSLDAVVIPHYDNAEGTKHDTRRCYMGERRLRLLEEMLADSTSVLGVEEHTAAIFDLDAGAVSVRGRGGIIWRHRDREHRVEHGATVSIDELVNAGGRAVAGVAVIPEPSSPEAAGGGDPFAEGLAEQRQAFDAALSAADVDAAVAAALTLEQLLWDWSRATLQSDAADRARAAVRDALVRLGELAREGARDPREAVAPLVEALLALRRQARDERRFADADRLRDALVDNGVEVRDAADGTTWELVPAPEKAAAR
ncbi:MAG: hypothetical protein NVSMB29_14780 [Candidatus Dormibacteria bacterium]